MEPAPFSAIEWYDNENKQYITYVKKEFPMIRFTKLTESQFNEKIEKQNYVDKEEFGEYLTAIVHALNT